jgi:hypothetical protein
MFEISAILHHLGWIDAVMHLILEILKFLNLLNKLRGHKNLKSVLVKKARWFKFWWRMPFGIFNLEHF